MSSYRNDWKHLRVLFSFRTLTLMYLFLIRLAIVRGVLIQISTTARRVIQDTNPQACGLSERDTIHTNKQEEG